MHVKVAEPKGERSPGPRGVNSSFRERSPRPEMFVRPGFKRLYVGNLNFRTTAADLGQHFQQFGAVQVGKGGAWGYGMCGAGGSSLSWKGGMV
jgi:RNA recognition motif-containing protein